MLLSIRPRRVIRDYQRVPARSSAATASVSSGAANRYPCPESHPS